MAGYSTTVAVVGVNNGTCTGGRGGSNVRRVLISPYNGQQQLPVGGSSQVIEKVLLKTVTRTGARKEEKIFTLRRITPSKMLSCDDLKKEIKKQLAGDVGEEFDVGYSEGSKVVNLRSKEDMAEVWKEISKHGDKIRLWCDGLKKEDPGRRKRKRRSDDDEDDDFFGDHPKKSAQQEREDKIKNCLDFLKKKHGAKFSNMQYHMWAEMKCSGTYSDLENPPAHSMFKRAGTTTPSTTPSTKKNVDSSGPEMAQALTQAASQVSAAIVAACPRPKECAQPSNFSSPAKVIENRSKCYKQLGELKNLMMQELLGEEDYEREKNAILQLLKKLV